LADVARDYGGGRHMHPVYGNGEPPGGEEQLVLIATTVVLRMGEGALAALSVRIPFRTSFFKEREMAQLLARI